MVEEENIEKAEVEERETKLVDATTLTSEDLEKYSVENITEPLKETPPVVESTTATTEIQVATPSLETPPKTETEILKEKLDFMEQRANRQSKLLSHMGNEIGMLRKTSPEDEKARIEEIKAKYWEDPIAGQQAWEAYKAEKVQLEQEEQYQKVTMEVSKNREKVDKLIPDFSSFIDDIVELAKQDGYNDQMISAFRQYPYFTNYAILYNMVQRVKASKDMTGHKSKVDELTKEIETLKSRSSQILNTIEKETSKAKPINGSPGNSTVNMGLNNKPVHSMSTEELKELEKQILNSA